MNIELMLLRIQVESFVTVCQAIADVQAMKYRVDEECKASIAKNDFLKKQVGLVG